jgi:hypothetical protein
VSALGSTIARSSARLACALALAVGVGACAIGHKVSHPTTADSEQIYVDAGKVTYQVQITRALNPWSTEDRQYLFGVPSSEINLQPDQLWFGVFLWAKDQTHQAVETTDKFTIVDSAGDVYHPIPLNPVTNPYAWNSEMLEPGDTEPVPDTTAALGPTQGGLILFKLNDSVYSNRPLTLNISAAGQAKPSTVSLDL